MTLGYDCPYCKKTVSTEALEHLSSTPKKVTYLCKCPYCKREADIEVEIDAIDKLMMEAEDRLVVKIGKFRCGVN